MYEIFANTMTRLKSRFSTQIAEQTQALPCNQRHHLAHTIETELYDAPLDQTDLLHELDHAIEETKASIKKMERSECLLYENINKYRKVLDSYGENDELLNLINDGVMKSIDLEKVRNYEIQLHKIQDVHREIMIGLEHSRRKLTKLQLDREEYIENSEECMEFLQTSADLDKSHGDDVDEVRELEICALNRQRPESVI